MARTYSVCLGMGYRDDGNDYVSGFGVVPPGETWVVRDVTVNAQTLTNNAVILLTANREDIPVSIYALLGVQPDHVDHWEGRVVLEAGDVLAANLFADTGGYVAMWVSGYRLGA